MAPATKKFALSSDLWAVILSLFLALLVGTHVIKTVAW